MKIKAIKMHCNGNDFVLLDIIDIQNFTFCWSDFARYITDRHFGIGGDGLVLIEPRMRIFNSDGSEAETCGSAILCTAFYLYEKYGDSEVIVDTIKRKIVCNIYETPPLPPLIEGGDSPPSLREGRGGVYEKSVVSANMGTVIHENDISLQIKDTEINGHTLNIGNPHFAIFDNGIFDESVEYWELIENHPNFPNRINIENIEIINQNEIKIKIWERGCGFTLSCGSGACVSAFIAHKLKKLDSKIKVHVPGGELIIEILNDNSCVLTGQVTTVFETEIDI